MMNRKNNPCFVALLLLFSSEVLASVFGDVRGIVRDPQHRPIAGAAISLRARFTPRLVASNVR